MNINEYSPALTYGGGLTAGMPFIVGDASIGTIALSTGAGTVVLLSGASVLPGKTIYVTGFAIRNISTVTLVGAGSIYIEDTAGTPIWGFAITRLTTGQTVTSGGTLGIELKRYDCSASAINTGIVIGTSGSITSDGTLSAVIWGLQK